MKHTYFKCDCDRPYCQFCDGGLGLCTVCNGFEGTLPTDCPGEPMDEETQDRVYKHGLDFKDGKWVQRV